jgi:hypothetical protein
MLNLFMPDTVKSAIGSIQKTIDRLIAIREKNLKSAEALRNMADSYLEQADDAEVEAAHAADIVRNLGNLIGAAK